MCTDDCDSWCWRCGRKMYATLEPPQETSYATRMPMYPNAIPFASIDTPLEVLSAPLTDSESRQNF